MQGAMTDKLMLFPLVGFLLTFQLVRISAQGELTLLSLISEFSEVDEVPILVLCCSIVRKSDGLSMREGPFLLTSGN